jgi:hypothetical protein
MRKKEKNKGGAPKGNKNAAKYYSEKFDELDRADIASANSIEGIDEEIALLRHEIKAAVSGGDERNLLLLVKASSALERLIRTRYRISASHGDGLKEGIGNLLREILVPLGVNFGSALISRKLGN